MPRWTNSGKWMTGKMTTPVAGATANCGQLHSSLMHTLLLQLGKNVALVQKELLVRNVIDTHSSRVIRGLKSYWHNLYSSTRKRA